MADYRYPDSSVFYRKLTRSFPCIVRGDGCYLYDNAGKRYLDACGGAFVANIGHGVQEIAQSMAEQAGRLAYVNGTAFTHEPAEELAAQITALCPEGLSKAYFLTGGSEAVEAALKLARQYWVESGKPQKSKIIALRPSYHGNTLLALSVSAREHYKTYFKDWLVNVSTIPAPYPYRCRCGGADGECRSCGGWALEDAIAKEGPNMVAAFIAEPIGGSSTGASVPRGDYFKHVREICDRYQVLFIADEVLTGAGRTGTWTAMEHYGISPDILILGKGITGGYAPLSALLTSERLLNVIAQGSGALLHAQTFSHNPLSCAAALATLRYIHHKDLLARCAEMGNILHQKLKSLLEFPHIGDVRGWGLLAGVEFVEDKQSKASFPRSLKFAETFTEIAQSLGLVVWPNTGHADGTNGDLVLLAPPFIITEAQLEELVSLFKSALEATIKMSEAARTR